MTTPARDYLTELGEEYDDLPPEPAPWLTLDDWLLALLVVGPLLALFLAMTWRGK